MRAAAAPWLAPPMSAKIKKDTSAFKVLATISHEYRPCYHEKQANL